MIIPTFPTLTCRYQSFDSEIFRGPVLRLEIDEGSVPQIAEDLAGLAHFSRTASVKLISCRIPGDSALSGSLEKEGFKQVEELIVYVTDLERESGEGLPSSIGVATKQDREPCERLAVHAFIEDRYHADERIDDEVANRIKRQWVRNSFGGRADKILVAKSLSGVSGFIICRKDSASSRATIDLVAVSQSLRGRGTGKSLVSAAMDLYAGKVASLVAGTQSRNVSSCRLYSSLGFSVESRWWTYHLLPNGKVSR